MLDEHTIMEMNMMAERRDMNLFFLDMMMMRMYEVVFVSQELAMSGKINFNLGKSLLDMMKMSFNHWRLIMVVLMMIFPLLKQFSKAEKCSKLQPHIINFSWRRIL